MHNQNIHSLSAVNYPTSPRRNPFPHSCHQYSGNIQRLSVNNPKIFKDFFACRVVLAANHQYPGNIQRPFSSSNQQQQPAAATSSSNQQQQPAAATSSSNQQQQPAAAISIGSQHSSYQQHLHNQRLPP